MSLWFAHLVQVPHFDDRVTANLIFLQTITITGLPPTPS
jgi:hypothetical protein